MEDKFLENVRELEPSVKITFDKSGLDSSAVVTGNNLQLDSIAVKRSTQLLNMDLKPKYKYATLDGLTKLAGETTEESEKAYLLGNTEETIFPLWSEYLGDGNLETDEKEDNDGVFVSGKEPEYVLEFTPSQKLYDIYIKGEEEWLQYPVDYDLIFEFETNISTINYVKSMPMSMSTLRASEPLKREEYVNVNEKITSINGGENMLTIGIENVVEQNGKKPVGQWVNLMILENISGATQDAFEENKVKKVTLKIKKWSQKCTTAKIMYFSSSKCMAFNSDEISSINVLEEKGESVDKLSYGITSNCVSVKIKNRDNVFIEETERLKKNRLVEPSIKVKGGVEHKLGKFYSDSWDVTADSVFVTCRGYDVLYNLQGLYIYYPMKKTDNTYTINENVTEREVFNTIFNEINKERNRCGIYGEEIEWEFHDTKEDSYSDTMRYVLLSYDKAWNMLNEMANYTRSYIYVDRNGKVIIERDGYLDKSTAEADKIKINSSNAFTYNLPTLCKTIVNRVVVKYKDKKVGTDTKTFTEKVTVEDFVVDTETNTAICRVPLKNYMTQLESVVVAGDYAYSINSVSCKEIDINVLNVVEDIEKLEIEITYTGLELEDKEFIKENTNSQKVNGVVEYISDSGLVYQAVKAKDIAENILTSYGNGRSYIETKWIGTPNLKLNDSFKSSSKYMSEKDYQCMSNEFTIENCLRVKTKAIQIIKEE